MNARDPKIDPQPGDRLSTYMRTRYVTLRDTDGDGRERVHFTSRYGSRGWVYLVAWRSWAKRATVDKVGGEK